jgi:F-type H+-transporting ATPase subunit b
VLVLGLAMLVGPLATPAWAAAAEEGGGHLAFIARLFNFAALVGILVYFLRSPIASYLRTRHETIRKDLVEAATLRSSAERQLADIRGRQAALPGELETLRRLGQEEAAAERARMKAATEKVRAQLLERTHHEIEFQFRQSRRALQAHVADLAISLARRKIEAAITLEDQQRLVERYVAEVRA